MSIKQSLALACMGFLFGATFASANLATTESAEVGDTWECGGHYWGFYVEITDEVVTKGGETKLKAEIQFSGDAYSTRSDVAEAAVAIDENTGEIVFRSEDEWGGLVRISAEGVGSAQETDDSNEVTAGDCSKN